MFRPVTNNASVNNALGNINREYSQQAISKRNHIFIRVLAVFCIAAFITAILQGIYGFSYYGQAAAEVWSRPTFILAGILLAIWILCALLIQERKIAIYKNGLAFWKAKRQTHTFLWKEIAGIGYYQEEWNLLSWKLNRFTGILYPQLGRPINLLKYCDKEDLPEIVSQVKAKFYPQLEKQLRVSLREMKSIYFSEISLSAFGIKFKNHEIPWSELTQINIQNGYLTIDAQSNHLKISLQHIPNFELLLPMAQLAKEICGNNTQPKRS